MELLGYLAVLRRRWLLIVITSVVGALFGFSTSSRAAVYEASTVLFVGSQPGQLPTSDLSLDRLGALDRMLITFARMIQSEPIASDAVRRAGIERSPDAVVAQSVAAPIPQTQLLQITVRDSDPSVAQRLANAEAEAFVEKVRAFVPPSGSTLTTNTTVVGSGEGALPVGLPAYVFESARLPTVPLANDSARRIALGALFGFLLSAATAFTLEYLDITVKSTTDAENKLGLPVLGVVPLGPVEHADAADAVLAVGFLPSVREPHRG